MRGQDEGLDGLRLLSLFQSVRAAIRAHVLFMKSEQAGGSDAVWQEAKRYFDLAGRLIAPRPPLLVAIGGLSGTGKSVLARGLAGLIEPPPGAVIIRSDVVRKHLFGAGETTALPESAYRPDVTERVYGMLSITAQRVLAQGCSVVLDAAYLQEAERTEIAHLATTYGLRFVGLFLTADLATRLARIERRQGDASDATRNVALWQETFAIGAVNWPMIDAWDAGPVTRQRPYFLVCGAGRALTMRVHPTGTSGRRKAAEAASLDCAAAFQKMALGCVAGIKAHHTSACAGDAEAVHQIRVAITRLRAAVAFFAPIVVDAEWLRLKKEIAWQNGSVPRATAMSSWNMRAASDTAHGRSA